MSQNKVILLSEVVGALSYALDITEGQPVGHSLRCCWIGMHVGMQLGLSEGALSDLYYTLLLKDIGCSSNAARICKLYLADDLSFKNAYKVVDTKLPEILRFLLANTARGSGFVERLQTLVHIARNGGEISRELIETRCQRGAEIARSMRFSDAVADGILDLDEHWDGTGQPLHKQGQDISLFARIALLAQVVDVFFMRGGAEAAIAEAQERSGRWFDPQMVETLVELRHDSGFWGPMLGNDLPEKVADLEPKTLTRRVDEDYLDDIAAGFAQVVDAKSPFTAGHSDRVSLFADLIAEELGYSADQRRWLKRAALLHDIGKLGVSNSVLDKNGKPDDDEWAQIRQHPELGRQILSKIAAFSDMARIAGDHHEKLNGRGYPHGIAGEAIDLDTRIVTVADIFDALTADRPYRKAMAVHDAFAIMDRDVEIAIDAEVYAALKRGFARLETVAEPIGSQAA
ncbi:HD-GYP domain-containing protein [Devosia chinhatensis]|uniref:Metal-dependent phosphohydrolase n=1 Tax=Devosia chinhatensis TaxID=429727 RepID=A0A0F5FMT2_9HYPH|nr:HD domain-containing protein [Devosia chinhatensis]KKB10118.1 metal-dependent phosphohydrolase [Devosia chinhatensis]